MEKEAFIQLWKRTGESPVDLAKAYGVDLSLALKWVREYRSALVPPQRRVEEGEEDLRGWFERLLFLIHKGRRWEEVDDLPPQATIALHQLLRIIPSLEEAWASLEALREEESREE